MPIETRVPEEGLNHRGWTEKRRSTASKGGPLVRGVRQTAVKE